ncbi:MAG: hypothetical protein IKR85_04480 [Clostridia bacterium]|nr:hypothetical protein [Clostridia bacterium]
MSDILETVMIVSFGLSWPVNAVKAWRARSAKSTSVLFLCLILFGYAAGIVSKLLNESYMADISRKWYVLFCYCLNFAVVSVNLGIYFRNRALDAENVR